MSIPRILSALCRSWSMGKLHAQGAIVYALSINPDNLKKLKEEFSNVIPICVDLANTEAIKTALEPIETVDCAVLVVSQIMAKKMIERGKGGSIVNMSSVSAQRPEPDMNRPESYANKEELELVDKGFQSILDKTPTGVVWMPMDDIVNTTLFLPPISLPITGPVLCLLMEGILRIETNQWCK
ncbi:L-xylulose reductase [Orchesella cincta]|uniref:L-xylulose reductase n=1 Tax=Orchesella cincta TaxID=48709 RepID=A0A1D2MEL6_ORCCI|nr:L-xylulose reductase [Orchesella cincta]